MTTEQYKKVYEAVRSYQLQNAEDKKLYEDLHTIMHELYPLANPSYHYRYSD